MNILIIKLLFFRYLEEWIYQGECIDLGEEYMIQKDSKAVTSRNRRYWTRAYCLKDLKDVPEFLKEVLKEAFACGKALNLLKLCSPKVLQCY